MNNRPDAIDKAIETTSDPERMGRIIGYDLPWTALPLLMAYVKLSRCIGKTDFVCQSEIVNREQALREIPDVIAYLARAHELGLKARGKKMLPEGSLLADAKNTCAGFSDDYRGIILGYDEPGDAIGGVYGLLREHISITKNEDGILNTNISVNESEILPHISDLIVRLNRAYILLAKAANDAALEKAANGAPQPGPALVERSFFTEPPKTDGPNPVVTTGSGEFMGMPVVADPRIKPGEFRCSIECVQQFDREGKCRRNYCHELLIDREGRISCSHFPTAANSERPHE